VRVYVRLYTRDRFQGNGSMANAVLSLDTTLQTDNELQPSESLLRSRSGYETRKGGVLVCGSRRQDGRADLMSVPD
jgi:DUF1009 family protein